MLLTVLDAGAVPRTEIVRGQETLTDVSGVLAVDNTWQILAPPNPTRSGISFQNRGTSPMDICDMGVDAAEAGATSWLVEPGGYWPPPGFPTTVGEIAVRGTAGDAWTARDY